MAFNDSPAELLGKDFVYPKGFELGKKLRKGKGHFGVWSSFRKLPWRSVFQCPRAICIFRAELYMESSDQAIAGGFQLSSWCEPGRLMGVRRSKQGVEHGSTVKT